LSLPHLHTLLLAPPATRVVVIDWRLKQSPEQ